MIAVVTHCKCCHAVLQIQQINKHSNCCWCASCFCQMFLPLFLSFICRLTLLNITKVDSCLGKVITSDVQHCIVLQQQAYRHMMPFPSCWFVPLCARALFQGALLAATLTTKSNIEFHVGQSSQTRFSKFLTAKLQWSLAGATEFKFESKFKPLPIFRVWPSLRRLFQKSIKGFNNKSFAMLLGSRSSTSMGGLTGKHKHRASLSQLQLLLPVTCSFTKKCFHFYCTDLVLESRTFLLPTPLRW